MTAIVAEIEVFGRCMCDGSCGEKWPFGGRWMHKIVAPQGFRWGKGGDLVAVYADGTDVPINSTQLNALH